MRINAKALAVILVATILGGVLVLMATGSWKTQSSKNPVKFSTGAYVGMSNPADIRGSYSFADVEKSFPVSAQTIAKAFAFDTSARAAGTFLAKDLEAVYGEVADGTGEVGTDSLKWFVSLYTGLPYVPEEDTYLPRTALELLLAEGKIDAVLRSELESKAVDPVTADPGSLPVAEEHTESTEANLIKGTTTYADVISWGVTQAQIEEILGMPLERKTLNIKDHLLKNNLSFSTVKTQLQALVDQAAK